MSETFCLAVSTVQKKSVIEPFLYFWKFLVFLKVSGAAHLSGAKILVNHTGKIMKKFERGLVLVYLEVSGIKKLSKSGVSRFLIKNFCLTVPENFVRKPSYVPESFWYLLHKSGYQDFSSKIIRLTQNFHKRDILVFASTCQRWV